MSLGEKLQSVAEKVNTKLGTQTGPITFRIESRAAGDNLAAPYEDVENNDLTITEGIREGRVGSFRVGGSDGNLRLGDLILIIPGNLVTRERLEACKIIHSNKVHSILNFRPLKVISGVATKWEVLARLEGE
jgi:hypothetical protein